MYVLVSFGDKSAVMWHQLSGWLNHAIISNSFFSYSARCCLVIVSSRTLFAPSSVRFKSANHFNHTKMLATDIVYFRHVSDVEPTNAMHINFHYKNDGLSIDRAFNLMRTISEPVDSCLERIRTRIEKEIARKSKSKKKKPKKGGAAAADTNATVAASDSDATVCLFVFI